MSQSTPKPPKAMSSRLLTMKFMQRAAASSPVSSAPSTPDQPSAKRRRLSAEPSPADINELMDQKAIAAALAEEEKIKEAAIERQAAQAGDTRWVLSFEDTKHQSAIPKNALRVVQTGFAGIDNAKPVAASFESEPMAAGAGGRRSFGKFNRTIEKLNNPLLEDSSDDSSDEDDEKDDDDESDDSEDEDDDTSAFIKAERLEAAEKAKAERKAAKKAAKKEATRLADLRKKKEVNLNKVTSISGSGGGSGSGNPGPCYNCGQKGHISRDCPKDKGDRRQSGDNFRGQPPSKKARQSR